MWSGNLWPEAKMSVLVDIAMSEAASQGVAAGRAHAITASVLTSLALRLRVASKRARKTAARLRSRDLVQVGNLGGCPTLMGFDRPHLRSCQTLQEPCPRNGSGLLPQSLKTKALKWGYRLSFV